MSTEILDSLHTVVAIAEDGEDGTAASLTSYYETEDEAVESAEILAKEWTIVLLFAPDTGTDDIYEERKVIRFWPTHVDATPVDAQEDEAPEPVHHKPKAAKPVHKAKKVAKPVL